MTEKEAPAAYRVTVCATGDLTSDERARCLEIIRGGNAVNPESAAQELPISQRLAVARLGNQIVGIGAIKRGRADYAARIAGRSGVQFEPETPELGYVAVADEHRGAGLSGQIVNQLLREGPLFATTSNPRMKSTLNRGGVHPRRTGVARPQWQALVVDQKNEDDVRSRAILGNAVHQPREEYRFACGILTVWTHSTRQQNYLLLHVA
jgi:hypothetical protein